MRARGLVWMFPVFLLPGAHGLFAQDYPARPVVIVTSAVVAGVNREMTRYLDPAEVREKLFGAGMEVAAGTPGQLAATMTSELARMGKVIRDAGIRGRAH